MDGNSSHILTSAYCIQNRTDPTDKNNQLEYQVLIPDNNGSVSLLGNNFDRYTVRERFLHPDAGRLVNFTINLTTNGTVDPINVQLDINDVGVIRLDSVIQTPSAQPVTLTSSQAGVGTRADVVGFGAPSFYQLHRTDSMYLIPSTRIDGTPITDMQLLFFKDLNSSHTFAQAVEVGDEGGPVVQTTLDGTVQIAIAQGTLRRLVDNGTSVETLVSFGGDVSFFRNWILQILNDAHSFPPTDVTNTTNQTIETNQTNVTDTNQTHSGGARLMVGFTLTVLLVWFHV
eukprot:TRINITY_DN6742_c0_g1_i8.p1 TRINITY_DN6742_c0_g1~~TRINITY_DN6742_c0_g1_i8.p1  ORF type:complete len:286 (+),score=50.92 TRINITY_DN6742_c0_g1_i8:680-1537(+)